MARIRRNGAHPSQPKQQEVEGDVAHMQTRGSSKGELLASEHAATPRLPPTYRRQKPPPLTTCRKSILILATPHSGYSTSNELSSQ